MLSLIKKKIQGNRMNEFYQKLCRIFSEDSIKIEEPMRNHTTFRIGGPAKFYLTPKTQEELTEVANLCRKEGMPYYVIGNGSNLLVQDKGYEGAVISTELLNRIWVEGEEIIAQSGILLSRLAKAAAEESLTGLEFAAGIPGTLGGAVVMNAGAYGAEMKEVLLWAEVLDTNGRIQRLNTEELKLGYRTSSILAHGYLVIKAGLKLCKGLQQEIYQKMEQLAMQRREKQPLEYPSAGSTFKRPKGYFAGKLIDDAGLRGFRIGDAQVSEKHCGFVINRGNATASDVITLCNEVKRQVMETSGVVLELEVKQL